MTMRDTLALLLSVFGITGLAFCALQGGWWLLGMFPAVALCWASAARAIQAEAREMDVDR